MKTVRTHDSRSLPRTIAALAAVIAFSVCSPAAHAASTEEATSLNPALTARTLEIPAALRDARVDVVRRTPVAGQLAIDASKIGAAGSAVSHVVATDLSGRTVPVNRTADGQFAVIQDPQKWVVVKPAQASTLRMRAGVQWLPGVCVPPKSNAGTAEGDTFSSYIEFGTVPVVWDTTSDTYRISGHVGVAKNSDERIGGALGTSATVKFSFEGVRDPTAPDYTIERIGLEGEQPLDLKFDGTSAPNPKLIVRCSVADEQKYEMDVRPRIALEVVNAPILGLGLEKTTVFVRAVRADNVALPLRGTVPVSIACEGGRSQGTESLAISEAVSRPSFIVRSMGVGDMHLVATLSTANEALAGSLTIRQTMPWAQLLAAILGGALGGYARRFMKGARKKGVPRRVVEGVLVGLVAFVAGVLGVGFFSLPAAIVATVAGAFLTGVAGGFAGVTLLEKLTTRAA